jgi:hypothetical protein
MTNRLDLSQPNMIPNSPPGTRPIRCPSIPTSPSERGGLYFDFKDANGTKLSPLGIPAPISMYQHIRYSPTSPTGSPKSYFSDNGGFSYSYPPPSSPQFQRAASLPYSSYMLGAGASASASAGLHRRMSEGGVCTGSDCMCPRHHHRRNSMAIKFGDDQGWEKPRRDMNTEAPFATDEMLGRRPSLKRPPSPISEGILKGDFSF